MSKSANGEILGVDPAALEAAMSFSAGSDPVAAMTNNAGEEFVNSPADSVVGAAGPQEIPPVPAMSAIEQFYGSPTRITQPDAGYYDEFPLPGQEPAADSAPQDAPYVPPDMPYVPLDNYSTASAPAGADSYVGPADFTAFQDERDFVRDIFLPDMSQYITEDDLPTFQQFDPTQLQAQINQLAMSQPIDTSEFLTAADLPTYDTSQFLTSADLPTYDTSQFLTLADLPTYDTSQFLTLADLPTNQQFDPTNLQNQITALQSAPQIDTSQFLTAADLAKIDTSQFLTASDLPTYDTSSFLTAADLPTYQPFDSSAIEKELADLRAQVGLLGQAPSQSFAQTQPYAPILDSAIR
tara:strand:+ start:703 stop:1761 length:1059 start_codon:yes stop_codon:yes gene_type:complete